MDDSIQVKVEIQSNEATCAAILRRALRKLREGKPEPGPLARVYAMAITDTEKTLAHFEKYAVRKERD